MGIATAKAQLSKLLLTKNKCLSVSKQLEQPYNVELQKDIEALEYAIRILGKIERRKPNDQG